MPSTTTSRRALLSAAATLPAIAAAPALAALATADPLPAILDRFIAAYGAWIDVNRKFDAAEAAILAAGLRLSDGYVKSRFGIYAIDAERDAAQDAIDAAMHEAIDTPATTLVGAVAKADITARAGDNYEGTDWVEQLVASLLADLRRLAAGGAA